MTPAVPAAATTAVGMLEALGAELGAQGADARLVIRAGQVPFLRVTGSAGPRLAEDIRAAFHDGAWLFWWSWGEPVPAMAIADAAALVSRVIHAAAPVTARAGDAG